MNRIIAALPADHPKRTTRQAFYVAISRARDRAELVTDDAWKLADQLEKATGERVAALDGVALQAAHETVFGGKDAAKREPGRAPGVPEATEHGHEAGRGAPSEDGRGAGTRYKTARDRDGNLPEPGAGHHQSGRDSGGGGHWRGRSHGPGREAAVEKSMEPTPGAVEPGPGMQRYDPVAGARRGIRDAKSGRAPVPNDAEPAPFRAKSTSVRSGQPAVAAMPGHFSTACRRASTDRMLSGLAITDGAVLALIDGGRRFSEAPPRQIWLGTVDIGCRARLSAPARTGNRRAGTPVPDGW